MTKQELVQRLIALPNEIEKAEEAVLLAHARLITAKDVLQQKEDSLLLGNMLDGKNAETRAAQARQYTTNEREALTDAEINLKNVASRLERLHVQLKSFRAVADLIRVPA
ncbi:hypothetical protein FE784_00590 [Paenibacillus hemerocallicola]|uniref:Uncharacterized protein n=1 Tax=Paenibacillus hemerocallicola TaxID=1172614 RepID=A0A5C4THY4_9BACL|nr:hypothetical protein [Paenibacillus hemerocallicola]TNJ68197.1 hypothetical protein FE784_00590 [Paenibacillus hemerocallicola]